MRFGATVLLFVCFSACVAALPRNQHVVNRRAVPPPPTRQTDVTSTWPYGFMEFASLWAKCREWELFTTTDPSTATEEANRSDMGTLGIACTDLFDSMKDMKTDLSPEEEAAAMAQFNDNFPLFQCTNLQIYREETMAFLEHDTNAYNDDPFLSMTVRLAEMCYSVFKAYDDQGNRPEKRFWPWWTFFLG
ncbi:uncharacterized protein LOC127844325 [Dreissena polymorpha]|uniref:Uncharacterized protein n=1 Tax=Dreissena polymorpha TaxID=45954 RepID=A0A9D4IG59_DREPO|nr:uncharacterized protein LOC127844325 [Dreissena polymorpha]KAH3770763.1 hypothetical protein DPMN_172056 [Dreissena polymorpha]